MSLNALSHGDLQAWIEGAGATARDEVGRIAGAVNVFRANLICLRPLPPLARAPAPSARNASSDGR